jgi:hypothetical protein
MWGRLDGYQQTVLTIRTRRKGPFSPQGRRWLAVALSGVEGHGEPDEGFTSVQFDIT